MVTKTEIIPTFLGLERQQKDFLKLFLISHIMGLFLIQLGAIGKYVHTPPKVPRKLYPIPDQNGRSLYSFSDQNDSKLTPFGAAHTDMAYIREYITAKKGLKACLQWKVHLAYPASLQVLHSNT